MRVSKTGLLLIECLVSICSMKNGIKLSLKDINGFYDVHWGRPSSSNCYRGYTSTSGKDLLTCAYMDKEDNCTINSIPYELKQVNQLFVNVESSTRVDLCKSGSNKTHCKKTVDVVAYFGNDGNTFTHKNDVGTIPVYSKPFHASFYESLDQLNFERNKKYKYVKLGIQFTNYCGKVKSVELFYYSCSSENLDEFDLIDLVGTNAPSKESSPMMLQARCIENAVTRFDDSTVTVECHYNGSMKIVDKCDCKPGYTNIKRKCIGMFILF